MRIAQEPDPRRGSGSGTTVRRLMPLAGHHCTLAVTAAVPANVNVQVFVLLPPLEQAPDQTADRLLDSVIEFPTVNEADPLLPVATLMPAGLEVMRSPLRPVAVTVNVAPVGGGGGGAAGVTVRSTVRVMPL